MSYFPYLNKFVIYKSENPTNRKLRWASPSVEAGNVPPERGGTCSNWGTRGLLMASAAPALEQLGVVFKVFQKFFFSIKIMPLRRQERCFIKIKPNSEQWALNILIKPNDMYSIGVEGGHNPLKWLSVWQWPFFKWGVCAVIKGSHKKWHF